MEAANDHRTGATVSPRLLEQVKPGNYVRYKFEGWGVLIENYTGTTFPGYRFSAVQLKPESDLWVKATYSAVGAFEGGYISEAAFDKNPTVEARRISGPLISKMKLADKQEEGPCQLKIKHVEFEAWARVNGVACSWNYSDDGKWTIRTSLWDLTDSCLGTIACSVEGTGLTPPDARDDLLNRWRLQTLYNDLALYNDLGGNTISRSKLPDGYVKNPSERICIPRECS